MRFSNKLFEIRKYNIELITTNPNKKHYKFMENISRKHKETCSMGTKT